MSQPKVLVFDIETAPMLAYVFGRKDQNIGTNQIYSDWYVLAWSAKWLGDPASKIFYRDQRNAKRIEDDRAILLPLWKLLDEADIVITQNGKNFDSPRLNSRFILNGMKPPSPYKHWDTYQLVRRVARFTSNSLEYLTDKLCVRYKKLHHAKFPGMSLWRECMAGNKKAWDEMRRYNIHDVLSTEELYNRVKVWAPESVPAIHYSPNAAIKCRTCGKVGQLQSRGSSFTKLCQYKRYQCKACGSWQQGEKIAVENR